MEKEAEKRKADEAAAEEDRKKKEEEKKREQRNKELETLKRADARASKSAKPGSPAPGGKKSTAEELKRKGKEDQQKAEEEKKYQEELEAKEKKAVMAEVAKFKARLASALDKVAGAGNDIPNTFRLADANNDGTVDLREFIATLSGANVKLSHDEINFLYEAIDENQDGKLQRKELVDVLARRKQIDVHAFVTKKRERLGMNTDMIQEVEQKCQRYLTEIREGWRREWRRNSKSYTMAQLRMGHSKVTCR